MTDLILRYVEQHPGWTLLWFVVGWWPLCGAIAALGNLRGAVTVKNYVGTKEIGNGGA